MIPLINYTILTDALHALKVGDIRHCESLGFTFDEMNALNELSLDELFAVSRAAAPFVSVSVRHDVLHHLLAQARQEYRQQQQINRAIRLGGSIALLNHYFGLTSNDVCFADGCWVSACHMDVHLSRMKRQMPRSGGNGRSAGWKTLNPPTR